jgi:phage gp46-like protein
VPDIRLVTVNTPDIITFDWLQTPTGDIDETQQLASAFLVALNTDALANDTDILPDPRDNNRRGWWGDLDADLIWNGWPIGSLLWVLTRAKILDNTAREGATVARAESYIITALQPFIDQKICTRITVNAAQTDEQRIRATIIGYRGPKQAIQLQYEPLWLELFPGS